MVTFSSHISLTQRSLVLFIFRRVTWIGHGMKYMLRIHDEYPGRRCGMLLSVYLSMQEKVTGRDFLQVRRVFWLLTVQTSTGAEYIASEEINYKPMSSQNVISNLPSPEASLMCWTYSTRRRNKQTLAWGHWRKKKQTLWVKKSSSITSGGDEWYSGQRQKSKTAGKSVEMKRGHVRGQLKWSPSNYETWLAMSIKLWWMSSEWLAGIMKINEQGQQEQRAVAGQGSVRRDTCRVR